MRLNRRCLRTHLVNDIVMEETSGVDHLGDLSQALLLGRRVHMHCSNSRSSVGVRRTKAGSGAVIEVLQVQISTIPTTTAPHLTVTPTTTTVLTRLTSITITIITNTASSMFRFVCIQRIRYAKNHTGADFLPPVRLKEIPNNKENVIMIIQKKTYIALNPIKKQLNVKEN